MKRALVVVGLFAATGCAEFVSKRAPQVKATPAVRLASVMWPTAKAIIYCTQRIDDNAQPIGVAGPCARLEAGEAAATKIISWGTLGRFDRAAPSYVPTALSQSGRCHIEIDQGQHKPVMKPARLTWVTPTHREVLDEWAPSGENAVVDADAFTSEASFAPEGEWLAILHTAVAIGDGERVVTVAAARMMRVPACK